MFENFLRRLRGFPTSHREESLSNYLDQHPEVEGIILEMVLDYADIGVEEELPKVPTDDGGLSREYGRLPNNIEPSYTYEDQNFSKSPSQLARERHADEINGAYQDVRRDNWDNSSSRKEAELGSHLLIITGYIIPAFLIVFNFAGNALYDPRRPEDVNYNRLGYGRFSWGVQTLYNIIGKPMTQANYWVMVNIFNRLHRWSNWAADIGGVPHICCKVFFKTMEYISVYKHLRLNLLGWSAYFAPYSLVWDKIVRSYNSYLDFRASRNVITDRVNRLLSSSRAEVGGRYSSEYFARAHNLRNISPKSLAIASEEVTSLMSDIMWALAKPETYDFSNDTTKMNIILFAEPGKVYVQSRDIVTHPSLKNVKKNSFVSENAYNENSNYVLLPIPEVNHSEGVPVVHQTVEWAYNTSLDLVKDLIRWTGKNWQYTEVDFLFKGSKEILWRIRPQFDKQVKIWAKVIGTKVTGWIDSKTKELKWSVRTVAEFIIQGIEGNLPDVKVPAQSRSVPARTLVSNADGLVDKLELIWRFSWNSCLFFYYCGWSVLWAGHNVWGVMIGEVSVQNLLPAKKKSSAVKGKKEEESSVIEDKKEEKSWFNFIPGWLSFTNVVSGFFIKESDDTLVMQEVSEDMNVGNNKIVGSRLLISLDNFPERVFLHSLEVSDWLLACLNDVGLSPNQVITLYLGRSMWPNLSLDMVQGKGVFLERPLGSVSSRIPTPNASLSVDKHIQYLGRLQDGFNLAYGNVRALDEIPKGDLFLLKAIYSRSNAISVQMLNPSITNVKVRELTEYSAVVIRFYKRLVYELAYVVPSSDINLAIMLKYWTLNDNSRLVEDRLFGLNNMLSEQFNMVMPNRPVVPTESFSEIYDKHLQLCIQLYNWFESIEDRKLKLNRQISVSQRVSHRPSQLSSIPEDVQVNNPVQANVEDNDDVDVTDSKEMDEYESKERQWELDHQSEESVATEQSSFSIPEGIRVPLQETTEEVKNLRSEVKEGMNKLEQIEDAMSHPVRTAIREVKKKGRKVVKTVDDQISPRVQSAMQAGVEGEAPENYALEEETPREEATINVPEVTINVPATEEDVSFSMDQHRDMQRSRTLRQSRSPNFSGNLSQVPINVGNQKKSYQQRELLRELVKISIRYVGRLDEEGLGMDSFQLEWLAFLGKIKSALRDELPLRKDYDKQYDKYLKILREIRIQASRQEEVQFSLNFESVYKEKMQVVQQDNFDDSSPLTYNEVFDKIVRETQDKLNQVIETRVETIASNPSWGWGSLDGTNYMVDIAKDWRFSLERYFSRDNETSAIPSSVQPVPHSVVESITPSSDLKAPDIDDLAWLRAESADRMCQIKHNKHLKDVEGDVNLEHRLDLLLETLFNLASVKFLEDHQKYGIDVRIFDPNLQLTQNNMDVYLQSNALRNMVTLLIKHLKDRDEQDLASEAKDSTAEMLLEVFFSDREIVTKREDDNSNLNVEKRERNLDLAHDRIIYLKGKLQSYLENITMNDHDHVEALMGDKHILRSFLLLNLDFRYFNQLYEPELSNLNLQFSPKFLKSNWLRQLERYRDREEFLVDVNLVDRAELPRMIKENAKKMQRDSSNRQTMILRERAGRRVEALLRVANESNDTSEAMIPPLESGVSMFTGRHTVPSSLHGDSNLPSLEPVPSLEEIAVAGQSYQDVSHPYQDDDAMAVELPDDYDFEAIV